MENDNTQNKPKVRVQTYAFCPLCIQHGSMCRWAFHYGGVIHCFFACGDVVVTGKNMRCRYTDDLRKARLKKREMARMAEAQRRLAASPEADDLLSLTEGTDTNRFA